MKIFCIPSKLSLNFNLNILFKQNYAVNESAFVKYMQKIIFLHILHYFGILLELRSVWVSRPHHKFDNDTFSLTSPVGTFSVNKHHLRLPRAYTFEFQNVCFQSHWNPEQRSPFTWMVLKDVSVLPSTLGVARTCSQKTFSCASWQQYRDPNESIISKHSLYFQLFSGCGSLLDDMSVVHINAPVFFLWKE